MENSESVFDSTHIPEECFTEIRAEKRAKSQRETSSVKLAAVESCGYRRLIRVAVLVLKFLRIMKLLRKKDTLSQDE